MNRDEIEQIKDAVREVLKEDTVFGTVPLGDRWIGGELILVPRDRSLQEKRVPLEVFFHKLVMIRDRLRVLEQQINAHPKLDDEDRVHLQQYITRIYGTLTTFNILFAHKSQQFTGEGRHQE